MKKFILFAFLHLFSFAFISAQTTLLTEDFESDGEGSRYNSSTFSDCVNSDYFLWTNDNGPFSGCGSFGSVLSNVQGSWFWVAEDIESTANPNATFSTLTLNPLNVSGYSGITVSLFMATGRTGSQWEYSDSVKIQAGWDGGGYTTIGQFVGDGEFGGYLRQDTNLDGLADGDAPDITSTFTNFTFNVPGIGTNLTVRVRLAGLDGSEEFAFDKIVIQGSSTPPANYSPILANLESSPLIFTEGDAATNVTAALTITDPDNTELDSAVIQICSGFTSAEDVLTFSPAGGITGIYDNTTGILKLKGNASHADYQSVLRSVQYQNTNTENPSNVQREICFTVNDGTDDSNTQSRKINIMDIITDAVCIPFVESFETDGEGITYVSNTFNDSPSPDFFFRTNTQPSGHTDAVSGIDESYFWASEDIMGGSNGDVPGIIEFAPMTITGNSSFTFQVLMGTSNSTGTRWEQSDNILIQYNIDETGWNTFGLFQGDDPFGGDLRVDTDNDKITAGPYGATVPNGSVSDFSFNFNGSGDGLKIRMVFEQQGGSEELVFDDIRISGDVPVTATCKNDTVYLDNSGNASITANQIYAGTPGDCGVASISADPLDFDCSNIGENTVELTVEDAIGNSATCNATVTVLDNIAPAPICINGLAVELDATGTVTLQATDFVASPVTDNCSSITYSLSKSTFTCEDVGTNIIQLFATDESENSDYCETYVLIQNNNYTPAATCKDITVSLDETGSASITATDVDAGSSGNCGVASMELNLYDFDCSRIGDNFVTLTLTDNDGNVSQCNSRVTVVDNKAPIISPVEDIEILLEPGKCETAIDYPDIHATDNCNVMVELLSGLGSDGIFPVGSTTELCRATDSSGNTDYVSFNVKVMPVNSPPAIDSLEDITINKDTSKVLVPLTGISEGNDCESQVVVVSAMANNTELVPSVVVNYTAGSTGELELTIAPGINGTAEITVTVEDSEGAATERTFKLTIDTVNDPPFVVNPIADQVVNASYILKVPVSSALGELFDDSDDSNLTIDMMAEGTDTLPAWATYMNDTLLCAPAIADTGCVNIVVMATDAAGATATDTFSICVEGYPVSIGEIGAGVFEVNMYPNPTNGKVNLYIHSSEVHNTDLSVMDITGRLVLRKKFSASQTVWFDMSDKVSGMYFVHLNLGGTLVIKKLIVDRK